MASSILAMPSTTHILLLIAVILILFGGSKLPELARGLARGLRIFRDEMHSVKSGAEDAAKPLPPADSTTQMKDDAAPKM